MQSCVQPCPSAHVLRVAAAEGFEWYAGSPEARQLLHAAAEGGVESAQRMLLTADSSSASSTATAAWRMACNQAGDTALLLASRGGHLPIIQLLLYHQADMDWRNMRGEAALHAACIGGFAEVVHALCAANADPRLGELSNNEPPGLLAVRKHAEWVNSCGGPEKAPTLPPRLHERRLACIEACLTAMERWDPKAPAAASLVNSSGITGLHVAAAASDVDLCELLLQFSARVDAREIHEGATPLMHAVRAAASMRTVEVLLRAAADPRGRDRFGGTPLHYAVAQGDQGLEAVSRLLRARAAIDEKDVRGATALGLAELRSAPQVVRRLLDAGAHPIAYHDVRPLRSPLGAGGDEGSRTPPVY